MESQQSRNEVVTKVESYNEVATLDAEWFKSKASIADENLRGLLRNQFGLALSNFGFQSPNRKSRSLEAQGAFKFEFLSVRRLRIEGQGRRIDRPKVLWRIKKFKIKTSNYQVFLIFWMDSPMES